MEEKPPPVFRTLAELKAPIAHYKVCSTFDLAPQVGIDRAGDRPCDTDPRRHLAPTRGGSPGDRATRPRQISAP